MELTKPRIDRGAKRVRLEMKARTNAWRAGRLDHKNIRLKEELRGARSRLREDQDREHGLMDALTSMQPAPGPTRRGRGGRLIRLLAVGGAAYVFGAKAGRERYAQIQDWARRAARGGRDRMERQGIPSAT